VGGPVRTFFPVPESIIRETPPGAELRARLKGHPPLVFVPLSSDPARAREMLMSAVMGGPSLLSATYLWLPVEGRALATIVAEARDRAAIEALAPDAKPLLEEFLIERGGRFEDYVFVPLRGRYRSTLLALRKQDGTVAGVVATDIPSE